MLLCYVSYWVDLFITPLCVYTLFYIQIQKSRCTQPPQVVQRLIAMISDVGKPSKRHILYVSFARLARKDTLTSPCPPHVRAIAVLTANVTAPEVCSILRVFAQHQQQWCCSVLTVRISILYVKGCYRQTVQY